MSLGVVAVLIPATSFGLNIGTAVLFHEGSTLLVVINALRLLAYPGTPKASEGQEPAARAGKDADISVATKSPEPPKVSS